MWNLPRLNTFRIELENRTFKFCHIVHLQDGLRLTMSIPLASRKTVMMTYQALQRPIPQVDDVSLPLMP